MIDQELKKIKGELPANVRLIAVSKFHSAEIIKEAYNAGQRIFGESKVQELVSKYDILPKDIQWHFIGHLQTNKVKYIAPFIDTIHSVDSIKILEEINKCAEKNNRIIKILLQIHIAKEDSKFGFSYEECLDILNEGYLRNFKNVLVSGLMGMATFTDDEGEIKKEYEDLASFFQKIKVEYFKEDNSFKELSMGMSDDYMIAVNCGSTMVRIGSKIFGIRA